MRTTLICVIALCLLNCVACREDDDEKPTLCYSGKDISGQVEILRDTETKKAVINVNTDKAWTLSAGFTVSDIDLNKPLLKGNGKGSSELDVDAGKRYIFHFFTYEGQGFVSEKRLPITGGYNFRDLGGIKNKEGLFVKWGRLFRTDEMNKLTDADLAYIASTGLKTVVDFRTNSEKEGLMGGLVPPAPDKLPPTVKNAYDLPINAGNIFSDEIMDQIRGGATPAELRQLMINSYQEMVSLDEYVNMYKQFFAYIQDDNNLPLSFHCSAGKDRTGIAAMLILAALDVDKETIMKDYLLSKQYIAGKYERYLTLYPFIAPLVTVEKEYLEAAFSKVDEKYGSMNKFLTETLGIDTRKMKELYLY